MLSLATKKEHGTIVQYRAGNHYGFIAPDAGGDNVFFHRDDSLFGREVGGETMVGRRVSFTLAPSRLPGRPPQAVHVRPE